MKARLSSIGWCVICSGMLAAQGQGLLAPSRPRASGLGESLRREVHAALDRGVAWLASRQTGAGLWETRDSTPALDPALAFVEGSGGPEGNPEVQRVLRLVSAEVERLSSQVLESSAARQLALGTLLLRWHGEESGLIERAARRLRFVSLDPLTAEESFWILEAQEWRTGEVGSFAWGAIVAKVMALDHATPGEVALAGLARWERGGTSPKALQSHLRWLADRWPETLPDLLWMVLLLERLPPARLHEAGFRLDWRQQVADDVVRRQRLDPATGYGYWGDSGGDPESCPDGLLRDTTLALLTLSRLVD